MKNQALVLSLLGFALIFGFQNCASDVNFDSMSGSLVEKINSEDTETDTSEIADLPESEQPESPRKNPPLNNEDNGEASDDAHGGNFICILEGPGESVRLGFINDALAANGHTPDTVCLSEKACREIVGQKFHVKDAVKRGFCNGHNPHVVHLNDNQVQDRINQL